MLLPYNKTMAIRLGVHTSIAGGIHRSLERARELGCTTMQIFSHNPRGWAFAPRHEEECVQFRRTREDCGISPVFIHTSYLINLASKDRTLLKRSTEMVRTELAAADALGAEYVVLHTGSASGDDPAEARKRAAECLAKVAASGTFRSGLLLENTAGERGDISSGISDLAEMIRQVPAGLIAGICIDTCHAFSAGYDIRTSTGLELLIDELQSEIGSGSVRLIHLNDAKSRAGAGLDRHEHIGEGQIGAEALRRFLRHPFFSGIPIVLETPKKSDDDDIRNLSLVKEFFKDASS